MLVALIVERLLELRGLPVGFMPLVAAVAVAAVLGGIWSGLVATGLAALAHVSFFAGGAAPLDITSPDSVTRLLLFAAVGLVISVLTDRLTRVAAENARLYRAVAARGEELEAVVRAMDEAVLVADAAGRISRSNPSAAALFGTRPPATLEEAFRQLEPADGTAFRPWASFRRLPATVRATGRSVEASAFPVATAANRSLILVLRDVSAVREAEAVRDVFLGVLSHELRTPITTIYGAARLLRRQLQPDRRAELVEDLLAESDRLARLVEDVLVISRFEHGRLSASSEPLLLQRSLPAVVARERQRSPDTEFVTDLPSDLPPVLGDQTYVEQILRNLLTNAVKYGAPGGPVELSATTIGDEMAIRVRDRGPGIGAADRERLFDLFYRADTVRQRASGAGIGLFVCRQLAEAMDGRMSAATHPGGGAVFELVLPLASLELDEAEREPSALVPA